MDSLKPSVAGDSGVGKRPEEEGGTSRDMQESLEIRQTTRLLEDAGKPAVVRRVGDDLQPTEDPRAKEEAETKRKVRESLDDFIRQTIRSEPHMNFTARPGDMHESHDIRQNIRREPFIFENMPDQEKKGGLAAAAGPEDASGNSGQEAKLTGKQGTGDGKPALLRRVLDDPQPLEELRAKEEAETNRKVHESLDNFIRETIRCEPSMNFTAKPGDKPLQRTRPTLYEDHVAGKVATRFKVDTGSDRREVGKEENVGVDSHSRDVGGLKDPSNSFMKGSTRFGEGSAHFLKGPPRVATINRAAANYGTDLQDLLSPSKVTMTKCEHCTREFCATLNYRRHVGVHRRSPNPKKEDLSKERSKLAAFWDKLTPEEASSLLNYKDMGIEDLSGPSILTTLTMVIQKPHLPSLPQGIFKAGSLLLDIAQNRSLAGSLSSERLLNILDDTSEETFLCGGTSANVDRSIFNGDVGKIGLEEKNLVASLGFLIEMRLVKAWMVDKESEALRCEQALFKEEEATRQKHAKLLEKKQRKKIKKKERKGSASQPIADSRIGENKFSDDEGGNQRLVRKIDSPTSTGSRFSSLAI